MTERERHLLNLCTSVCLMLGDEALGRLSWNLANSAEEPPERIAFLRRSERLIGRSLTLMRGLIEAGEEGDA
ncbi:MAG TPA: hypothetical protein VN681_12370 [Stellaceae bacterium]|nr:hypothetical protein [Stellaceae bacterium]